MNCTNKFRHAGLALLLAVVAACGLLVNGSARASAEAADAGRSTAEDRAGDEIPAASDGEVQEVSARFQHAVIMLHAKEYGYAVTALRRVLELAPRMPEAHVNMGFALIGLGHPVTARDFFLTAIELRPQQINAYWGLAESLEALCDYPGAIGAMRTYVHLADREDPYLPRARAALWEWGAGEGDVKKLKVSPKSGRDCSPDLSQ